METVLDLLGLGKHSDFVWLFLPDRQRPRCERKHGDARLEKAAVAQRNAAIRTALSAKDVSPRLVGKR
jgi:hypothetical protein